LVSISFHTCSPLTKLLDLNLGTRSCRLLGCWLCA